ncbi:TPA: hypothetical protein NII00_005003 [Pseudomonas aeruginosa]|nr:hypothetical protein [Pseudomonas aeruginosa]HBO3432900.1 hypothetical protein [Pseudomonas aeruginosa]HCF6204834.1 hypothetical protein [Pseudomonas aeruginosa]HCF6237045.1 hypothetical protein [Pseudomonas aeruginosa]HCK0533810.1 hypothetical protein [Pseudomonas aeruginosa]
MTIIKNTFALSNYPYQMLSPEVVAKIELCSEGGIAPPGVAMKLLECYCHLNDTPVTLGDLASEAFAQTLRGFLEALAGEDLVRAKLVSRRVYARILLRAFEKMNIGSPWLAAISYDSWIKESYPNKWGENIPRFDPTTIRYWNCWEIVSKKGEISIMPLPMLWISHGKDFTEEFYETLRLFYEKQARSSFAEINKLIKFLSENAQDWPRATFYNPILIKQFFLSLMKESFMDAYHRKLDINAKISSWAKMISNLEEAFLDSNVWAVPFDGRLPKPIQRKTFGTPSRTRVNEDGIEVHEKLLTSVPLHLTDSETIEILFKDIESDLNTVKRWAAAQCEKTYAHVKRRKLLAQQGTPIQSGASMSTLEKMGLENVFATFERDGFKIDSNYLSNRYGGRSPKPHIAETLGLPTAERLFPFQCLLTIEHAEITPSFLKKLILHDANGDYIGFRKSETDGNWLIGFKDRRGSRLSEQKIKLNETTTLLIEQVIEITKPLRDFLRANGDDTWQELFITCGLGFSYPMSAGLPGWNLSNFKSKKNTLKILKEQFEPYTHRREEELVKFLTRVSLTTLRASSGVLVYLKTKSVTEMAKALGHARYDTLLMKRYLPEAILAFFQTRWIRIFQRGFICEAMKDSPYLLEAANFSNMEELHNFLTNHALKDIPHHLSDPEHTSAEKEKSTSLGVKQVLISIDPGIMTALISLEKAVDMASSPEKVCGRATYWADLSRAVVEEINRGNDYLLKQHLSDALSHCNPEKMESLIYGNASRA